MCSVRDVHTAAHFCRLGAEKKILRARMPLRRPWMWDKPGLDKRDRLHLDIAPQQMAQQVIEQLLN